MARDECAKWTKSRSETDEARNLVIGGTGVVGGYIVEHLLRKGQRPFALSRSHRSTPGVDWFRGDLETPELLKFPAFATLFCTADAHPPGQRPSPALQPVLEANCRIQFDQRAHKAGHAKSKPSAR